MTTNETPTPDDPARGCIIALLLTAPIWRHHPAGRLSLVARIKRPPPPSYPKEKPCLLP